MGGGSNSAIAGSNPVIMKKLNQQQRYSALTTNNKKKAPIENYSDQRLSRVNLIHGQNNSSRSPKKSDDDALT